MKHFFTFLFIASFSIGSSAKNLGVNISYAKFMSASKDGYVEVYFALSGKSLRFKKQNNGKYSGALDVLMTFSTPSGVKNAARFRINTQQLSDTNLVSPVLLHQERVALQPDNYLMFIQVTDVNDSVQSYPIETKLNIIADSAKVFTSDIVLLDRFELADKPSAFSKSGYNLFPIISNDIAYLPPSKNELKFYTEVYNTDVALGKNTPYAYRYFLINAKTQEKLMSYGKLKKVNANNIQPILSSFSVDKLSTGSYELVVQVLNQKGETLHENSTIFVKEARLKPLAEILANATQNDQNFAKQIPSVDSLFTLISYLTVVSTDRELQMQQEIKERKNKVEMQNYLFAFWEQKFPGQAEEIWLRYLSLVEHANKEFGTMTLKGYQTDRGYVYLTYGAPSQMEDRRIEPNLPPYQIWYYPTINTPWTITQSDKLFVFAEFQQSSNNYQLIHSTAIGEIQNRAWRYRLANGRLGPRGNLDNNSPDFGDQSGTRVNNNNIFREGGN